jgi:hypothetical protein
LVEERPTHLINYISHLNVESDVRSEPKHEVREGEEDEWESLWDTLPMGTWKGKVYEWKRGGVNAPN